jgi:hypothetical protein
MSWFKINRNVANIPKIYKATGDTPGVSCVNWGPACRR